jgi:hypothetical protein
LFSVLKNLFGKRRPAPARRGRSPGVRVRPGLEALEDRLVMSGFTVQGDQLIIIGTGGNDTFAFTAGPQPQATLNGDTYTWDPNQIKRIYFDGVDGHVQATVTDATGGIDYFSLVPGGGEFDGSNYLLKMTSAADITVYGDPTSDVNLAGSPGAKNYLSGGKSPDGIGSYARLNNDNYSLSVYNFDNVYATSLNAADSATLVGDGGGKNTFVDTRPTAARNLNSAVLSGTGYHVEADGFAQVHAYGQTPSDVAFLNASDSGKNTFTFQGSSNYANLSGTGYVDYVKGFHSVDVYAGTSSDEATFRASSSGTSTYQGASTYAELYDAKGSYDDTVHGFRSATAYAGNSTDVAYLSGDSSPNSVNHFRAQSTNAWLYNDANTFFVNANGFSQVTGFAVTSNDDALLYGASDAVKNIFESKPTTATLSINYPNATITVAASNFRLVDAYAATSADEAFFFGTTSGTNTFVAQQDSGSASATASLSGSNGVNFAHGFHHIVAVSVSGADVAYLYVQHQSGTGGYGPGYDVNVYSFDQVWYSQAGQQLPPPL